MDVFGLEPHHQIADIDGDIHQQQVRALAAAHHPHRELDVLGVRHARAVVHRDLRCGCQLPLQGADDEKPHDLLLSVSRHLRRSV